jgi:glutamate synthase (NADPH/NADH) large chain
MFLVDFEKGELLDDERIKSDFAKQNPYQDWLDEQTIHLSELHCCSITRRCTFSA